MTEVTGEIYPLSHFTWDKDARTLTAKLESCPGCLRSLWNDSLDLGFGVLSRTGTTVFFILKKVERSEDTGKIETWIFDAHNPDNSHKLSSLKVIISR